MTDKDKLRHVLEERTRELILIKEEKAKALKEFNEDIKSVQDRIAEIIGALNESN